MLNCLKMRMESSKMGLVIKLSTSFLFVFSFSNVLANPYGTPPRYSSYFELNDPSIRFRLNHDNVTTRVLEANQRSLIESAEFDHPSGRQIRMTVLKGLFKGYHQYPHLMAMLYDLWNRKSQQEVEITIFDWDGKKEKVRGRLVDLQEIGDYADPYLTLMMKGNVERRISLRIMSLTDLIKDHGFREIFDPSWRPGQTKTCRSILL